MQKFRIWISGQVRRVIAPIRRENAPLRRNRVGHRLEKSRAPDGRNYLKSRDGDRINVVLAAARLQLLWLARLCVHFSRGCYRRIPSNTAKLTSIAATNICHR